MNVQLLRNAMLAAVLAIVPLAAQKQPRPKSQKEVEALQAIFNSQDPDGRIAAVENLLTKFADTEFKSIALQLAAEAAQQKNDYEKMVIYAERTLEADPKNYTAMLMLANGTANHTREFDLDREEKLGRAEKYAKDAMALIPNAAKPNPSLSDADWEKYKKDFMSQGHEALGMSAAARKKYDVAVSEMKLAVDGAGTPEPATMVRLARVLNQAGKPDEAIAMADKVLAMPGLHPMIQRAAQEEKNSAAKAKAAPARPAASQAPPQVEIQKN